LVLAEGPKQRLYDESLLRRGVEFHGHGGPFMVIGLRMGLLALEELNVRGWFGLSCVAELEWAPPDSCVLDGIQVSTGCTMGKRNIRVEERKDVISASFTQGGRGATIRVRDEILTRVREELEVDDHDVNKETHEAENLRLMDEIAAMSMPELFIVSRFERSK
jgi:formylmethanofuran dehydrogenase subunit E